MRRARERSLSGERRGQRDRLECILAMASRTASDGNGRLESGSELRK